MDNEDPHLASLHQQFSNFFKKSAAVAKDMVDLVSLEASLAQQSIFMLLVLAIIAIILVVTIWGCALAAFFAALIAWHFSIGFAFLILAFLNLLILAVVVFLMRSYKKNLGFSASKRQLTEG
jgi:large-conductance mechanosensitive channel